MAYDIGIFEVAFVNQSSVCFSPLLILVFHIDNFLCELPLQKLNYV